MKYKIRRDDEPEEVPQIIIYIGLHRFRITETVGLEMTINKMSDGASDDISIDPEVSNQIRIDSPHLKPDKMKTKHTTGPWSIDDSMAKDGRKHCLWYYIRDKVLNNLAEVKGRHCGIKNSTAEANAKLISTSPELLESLYNLVNAASGDTIENLKIALADAKGIIKKATS